MENNKTNSKVSTLKFATVQLPKIEEKIGKDWILFGGDNLFPNFLIEMMNKSSMNRRCIQAKTDATVGKGLTTGNEQTEYVLKRANPHESWNEVLEKVALDYVLFGGYAINVIWTRDGSQISEVYHLDFSKVRSGKLGEDDMVEEYYYCFDWTQLRRKEYKPQKYHAFDPDKAKKSAVEGEEGLSQILYVKNYQPSQTFYPLPEYAGSLNDIQLDVQISEFHNSNLSNGLTPNLWVHFNDGDPGPEGRYKLWEEISDAYSGAHNAGRFFLTFSDTVESAPTITPLTLANDGYYLQLEERIASRILSGHGISSPLLLGLRVGSSGLGSNSEEIKVSWQHYLFTVIRPLQKTLLKTFNTLMYYKGYPEIELAILPEAIFTEDEIVTETKITEAE
jgi:hypothetical protein